MEQFYYTLDYLEGDKNILAACFSRLPQMDTKILVGKKELDMNLKQKGTLVDFKLLKIPANTDEDEVNFVTTTTSKDWLYNNKETYNNKDEPELFPTICKNDNSEMNECLLNLPSYQYNDNPLTLINIANHQQANAYLMQNAQVDLVHFLVKIINNIPIIYYREELTMNDNIYGCSIFGAGLFQ